MEFEHWLKSIRGGQMRFQNPHALGYLAGQTTARIGAGRAGTRPETSEWLRFRVDHSAARDAIFSPIDFSPFQEPGSVSIQSQAQDREEYLLRPDLGRRVFDQDLEKLRSSGLENAETLLLIGDGLSSFAIEKNLPDILPSLRSAFQYHRRALTPPIFIRFARVGVMDHIGEILRPQSVVYLIGERPGLRSAQSMSAYLCFQPNAKTIESDRDVISNIHVDGLPPVEAGAVIADKIVQYLEHESSGVALREKNRLET